MKRSFRRSASVLGLLTLAGFTARPDLYVIPLKGTGPGSRLVGTATLTPARSPFGLATTRDGHFVFELEVAVPILPPITAHGGNYTTYVAWLATAQLDRVERLGAVIPGAKTRGKVAMSKFMVIITAEPNASGAKWTGPIVMRGNSASSYLTNFSGHTMFNGGVPQ
ncbi:MAG: hypothetical protein ACKVZ0_25125 [Gemmatimonadales bacterium]